MTRHLALGNGSLLVNVDKWLQVRDLYWPHVGQENHLLGNACRLGVFVDGRVSWVNTEGWQRSLGYVRDALVSDTSAKSDELQCEARINDCVHFERDVFVRKVTIKNTSGRKRLFTLFCHHDFRMYGEGVGDTAGYDPTNNAVFHYKRKRYVYLAASRTGKKSELFEYSITADGGSFEDAEDGRLAKGPIGQGSVDSNVSVQVEVGPGKTATVYYWLCVGHDFGAVFSLHEWVLKKSPAKVVEETARHWKKWLKPVKLQGLDKRAEECFRRSLLIIRTQVDKYGAIVAANDSDNLEFNRDTYSYMWPRDGAIVAIALQRAGYASLVRPFYDFCRDALSRAGCLLHKYNPDVSLGSSWHPYVGEKGEPQLPVQEDSTALVLGALWDFYEQTKDRKFIQGLYKKMVKPMAEFLAAYRYRQLGLPRESYDLWEERHGIFTFTCNTVCFGLSAAAKLARLVRDKDAKKYERVGKEVHDAVLKHLYDEERGQFLRGVSYEGKEMVKDPTIESSLYSTFAFCGLPAGDGRVVRTMEKVRNELSLRTPVGGVARYRGDYYHFSGDGFVPGNPWFVCTAWVGRWIVAKAKSRKELEEARGFIDWMIDHSLETGVMPEQLHPATGEPLSVSPLTWSHAEFVLLCLEYNEKYWQLK